jgi:hypothetical protein
MDIIDIFRVFHSTTMQYIFFTEAQRTFSEVDHISGHKASMNKFKKTEIAPTMYQVTVE